MHALPTASIFNDEASLFTSIHSYVSGLQNIRGHWAHGLALELLDIYSIKIGISDYNSDKNLKNSMTAIWRSYGSAHKRDMSTW